MPEQFNHELYKMQAELCKTFSEPKRLIIISALRGGEKSVGELIEILQTPQTAVSRHLAILRHRGIVAARRKGTNIYYSLTSPRIGEACDIVREVLLEQVARNKEIAKKFNV